MQHILQETCQNFDWLLSCRYLYSIRLQIYIKSKSNIHINKIYIKSESNMQISYSEQLFPWKMGAKGPISLMLLINGDRLTVHLTSYGGHNFFRKKISQTKKRAAMWLTTMKTIMILTRKWSLETWKCVKLWATLSNSWSTPFVTSFKGFHLHFACEVSDLSWL